MHWFKKNDKKYGCREMFICLTNKVNQQRLIFKNATKILNIRKVLNLTIGQRKQKEI